MPEGEAPPADDGEVPDGDADGARAIPPSSATKDGPREGGPAAPRHPAPGRADGARPGGARRGRDRVASPHPSRPDATRAAPRTGLRAAAAGDRSASPDLLEPSARRHPRAGEHRTRSGQPKRTRPHGRPPGRRARRLGRVSAVVRRAPLRGPNDLRRSGARPRPLQPRRRAALARERPGGGKAPARTACARGPEDRHLRGRASRRRGRAHRRARPRSLALPADRARKRHGLEPDERTSALRTPRRRVRARVRARRRHRRARRPLHCRKPGARRPDGASGPERAAPARPSSRRGR